MLFELGISLAMLTCVVSVIAVVIAVKTHIDSYTCD